MSDTTEDTTPAREAETSLTESPTDEPATPEATETEVEVEQAPEVFPREVVEKLRQENGKYRQRAKHADALAQRLHTELVRATGKLADPSDLPFDETHLDDPEALADAIDDLLDQKPHLASRRPVGDIGQGHRGAAAEPFSLLGLLKQRT